MSENLNRLLTVMARLRDPKTGCPWDVEQSFATIAPYTIEEAYEVADAIAREDMHDLKDELGDLLLQVVFHARMAEEAGEFDFDAVAGAIADKMIRRHPHVFGDEADRDAGGQRHAWEEQKAAERDDRAKRRGGNGETSALDGVPTALPALMRAEKLGKRAARVGFDWPDLEGVFAKIAEESDEIRAEAARGDQERLADEVGDLLFAAANLARKAGVDAEAALQAASRRFEARFRHLEATMAADGRAPDQASLDELESEWQAAKAALAGKDKAHG